MCQIVDDPCSQVEEEGLRFSALRGGGAWEVAVARNIEKHILKQKLIR